LVGSSGGLRTTHRNRCPELSSLELSSPELSSPELEDEFERGTRPKRFRYGELAVATGNFSDTQKLGEGGFGSVYRVSKGSKQGRKEYASVSTAAATAVCCRGRSGTRSCWGRDWGGTTRR
jgi:hypothetical protein